MLSDAPKMLIVTSLPSSSAQRSHEKLVSSPLMNAAALVTPW